MTDHQKTLVLNCIYIGVILGYIGVLLYLGVPGIRERLRRSKQWADYYRWRANWATLPSYLKEALTVRGLGPAEG